MRVFASDIDGCLADASDAIEKRCREYFGLEDDPSHPDAFHIHEKYGLDKGEVKSFLFSEECFDDPRVWFSALPMSDNIAEMNRWVLEHRMVPSLITARPPRMRLVTEAWCAKHNVPYSNFLLGVDNKGISCYHIDADFMIEDQVKEAEYVAMIEKKCYVIRHSYNADYEAKKIERESVGMAQPWAKNLIFVDNYKQISELEGL